MYAMDRCQELAQPDIINFAVSVFILVGILVSYLPQHYKIISRRSSRGLSPMFVLLGTVSGTASIANILTLPESTRDMGCCKEIGPFPCAAALLGIAQIAVQWSCFFMIKLLFLIFFPHPSDSDATEADEHDASAPTWKEAIMVLTLSMTFFFFVLFGSVIVVYAAPSHIRSWANFLGLLGSAFATVQYIPQILTTWKLQEVGSLSIPMMCIQTPGSALFAASLAVRLGPAGWSAWGIFIVTGILQGCLLIMCLWFTWRDRRTSKAGNGQVANGNGISYSAHDEGSEQTPLLGNER